MISGMSPWSAELAGRIDEHVISSELLRGNPLGDPSDRPLLVYTPPGYDDEPGRAYPAVYVIQGYTGHVAMWRNRTAFRLSLAWLCQRITDLPGSGAPGWAPRFRRCAMMPA
jgi:hypothetical protein